jgi:formylmethanofuran--tetrahydromethanopterin N-formyltransferase
VGQCILTCPTTACYNGLDVVKDKSVRVGGNLRFFGDGWQFSKKLEGRRYWRLPVMDGEFVCEDRFGTVKGVGGGNFLILADTQEHGLEAAMAARAAAQVPGVIMPFPGGIVRSGSKVGSKYKKLRASTNDAYCPTLRGAVESALPDGVAAVYEIVIDGLDQTVIAEAMRRGIQAACQKPGVVKITAGNYGGKLGPHHFYLHKIMPAT